MVTAFTDKTKHICVAQNLSSMYTVYCLIPKSGTFVNPDFIASKSHPDIQYW